MDKVWNIFWRIATILYFGDWDRRFLQSMISHENLKTHKLVPSLLLAPCRSLPVLRSHDVPSSIKFFCFALLKLSRFRSNPSVCGNCPKVRERKGNFTWILHECYIQVINCSLKFLSESSKLCEVNVIGKNVWFIQIPPLLLFSLNSRHYSITSSLIFFFSQRGKNWGKILQTA